MKRDLKKLIAKSKRKAKQIIKDHPPESIPTRFDTEWLVCKDIYARQAKGVAKYGTTVSNNPLSLRQWLQHAYEECLDQAIYLKRAMQEMDSTP